MSGQKEMQQQLENKRKKGRIFFQIILMMVTCMCVLKKKIDKSQQKGDVKDEKEVKESNEVL